MQKSDFILTIKKESDRMVEAWNENNNSLEFWNHITNMNTLIHLYINVYVNYGNGDLCEIRKRFAEAENNKNPLLDLVDLALLLSDCLYIYFESDKPLSDNARKELGLSISTIQSEIENLPIPVELR